MNLTGTTTLVQSGNTWDLSEVQNWNLTTGCNLVSYLGHTKRIFGELYID